jgi:hypothetical protein
MLSIGMDDQLRLVFNDRWQTAEITARNSQQKQRMNAAAVIGQPGFPTRRSGCWLFFLSK